jgi:ubiquinone biosynthesis protein
MSPPILAAPWFARAPVIQRSRQVAAVLAGHGLTSWLDHSGLRRFAPLRRGETRPTPLTQAEHLRLALGELGVTFIKLGQMLSTRADLLPPDTIEELARLQDAAPHVPWEHIEHTLTADLGAPPDVLFASFDRMPVASASIGQVHAAILHNGQPVVVKVRRPGVVDEVERDLEILWGMARWARDHTPFGRDFDLEALVEEFSYTIRNELDYVHEGQNADRFRRAFAGDPVVVVPWVFWDLTTRRVLTLERMEGIKLSDLGALDEAGIRRRSIAENSVRLFARQVLEFGFFHADPHPGNFFVRPDGSIALVDFGMVGRLSERLQLALLRAGLAAIRQDPEMLAEQLYSLGVAGRAARYGPFQRDLDHVLTRYAGVTVAEVSLAAVTREITSLAFRHRLQLPSDLALLFRVVAMAEGMGLRLDPDFHFLESAEPLIKQHWHRRHSLAEGLTRLRDVSADALDFGFELPRRAQRLMGRMERGQLELNVNHEGLHDMVRQFQRMTNRLAMAVVLAASIVALGLAVALGRPQSWTTWADALLTIGFVSSLVFGAWLLIAIWRSRGS